MHKTSGQENHAIGVLPTRADNFTGCCKRRPSFQNSFSLDADISTKPIPDPIHLQTPLPTTSTISSLSSKLNLVTNSLSHRKRKPTVYVDQYCQLCLFIYLFTVNTFGGHCRRSIDCYDFITKSNQAITLKFIFYLFPP